MGNELLFREAEENDLAFLVMAERLCFPPDAWTESLLRAHMDSPVGKTFLLEKGGDPVAYLLASVILPEGEVLRIATLPHHRQGGYAKALLARFLETVPLCFLEVRESNTPARRLYEALGFIKTGTRAHYYQNPTEDACLYKKDNDTHNRL